MIGILIRMVYRQIKEKLTQTSRKTSKRNEINSDNVVCVQQLEEDLNFPTINFGDAEIILSNTHRCLIIEEFTFLQPGKNLVVLVSEADPTF